MAKRECSEASRCNMLFDEHGQGKTFHLCNDGEMQTSNDGSILYIKGNKLYDSIGSYSQIYIKLGRIMTLLWWIIAYSGSICQNNILEAQSGTKCDIWHDEGKCTKDHPYAMENCKKSCGLCGIY